MAKYDWALIKREYIRGYKDPTGEYIPRPTLKQISDRHECNYGYLRKKASPTDEDWEQKRNIYLTKKEQRITEKEIEKISDESVELDNSTLNASKEGIRVIISRLTSPDVSNHDISKLSSSLLDFQKAYKNVFGEPTEHTHQTGKTQVDLSVQDQLLTDPDYLTSKREAMDKYYATKQNRDNTS